ncbi:MAG: transcription factor [Methanomicrobiales archaeon]|nr:transcription factor [Methanomicrobiales archaeon]
MSGSKSEAEGLLKDPAIREYLLRLIGEEGIDLIVKFPEEGEFSDEELAAKTGINLNSVRHTLYTLYEKRLAEYRRIKNVDTGWLTYLWKLNLNNIDEVIREDLRYVLEKLEARRRFEEENDFYVCNSCGTFTFNQVAETNFLCPVCGKPVEHFDNEILLKALIRRIEEIRGCISNG